LAKPQKEATLAPREAQRETAKPEANKPRAAYSFPTKSRCPRCKGLQTRRENASPDGSIQYRHCLAPVCRGQRLFVGNE
jgi:hypothetical protein